MLEDARRAAIRKMIEDYTAKMTTSRATARECLIREGFYTADGNLTEQYGGPSKCER